MSARTPTDRDTDLTQPGQTPGHEDEQPGQTGAPGRDVPSRSETPDAADTVDESTSGTSD